MAKLLQTLEHLDGKQVRFSTITSQYPEIFVKRKKNTGELIISTDTDPKYGMHHIYAGGEHIASGYGFATVDTRNDLTYIQETYNGIFKYFNQAYTYHNNAYSYLSSYVINSYEYLKNQIFENSYKRILVDSNNNNIKVNEYTYTLSAINGKLALYPDYTNFMQFNHDDIYYLKKSFATYNAPSDIEPEYVKNISKDSPSHAIVPVTITRYRFSEDSQYEYTYEFFTSDNEISLYVGDTLWNSTTINNNISSTNFKTNVPTTVHIPIRYNYDTDIYCNITKTNNSYSQISNGVSYITTYSYTFESSRLKFRWIDGVIALNTDIAFNNLNANHLTKATNIVTDISKLPEIKNVIIPTRTNTYTFVFVPNYGQPNIEPRFYVSNDLSQKENNEGGFVYYDISYNERNNLKSVIRNSYYNVYMSEYQTYPTTLRYDIDFVNTSVTNNNE